MRGGRAALVVGLVDDAAVFPPGNAPTTDAVLAHRAHLAAPYGYVVGPFLAPVSRLGEVLDALDEHRSIDPLTLVLIADTGLVEAAEARAILLDDDRVELVGLEVALPPDGPLDESARLILDTLDFALPAAVEIPRASGWKQALDVLGEDGAERAKLRTGGATASAHPSDAELAEFVVAAVHRGVAFKLTAGLHHALRRTADGTGFEEHGFVNVLAATAAALDGREVPHVTAVLAERDAAPLLAILADADPRAVRRRFTSFGSCSVTDPVDDLRTLGMIVEDDVMTSWVPRGRRIGLRGRAPALRRGQPRPRAARARGADRRPRAVPLAAHRPRALRRRRAARRDPLRARDARRPARPRPGRVAADARARCSRSSPTARTPTWRASPCSRSTTSRRTCRGPSPTTSTSTPPSTTPRTSATSSVRTATR